MDVPDAALCWALRALNAPVRRAPCGQRPIGLQVTIDSRAAVLFRKATKISSGPPNRRAVRCEAWFCRSFSTGAYAVSSKSCSTTFSNERSDPPVRSVDRRSGLRQNKSFRELWQLEIRRSQSDAECAAEFAGASRQLAALARPSAPKAAPRCCPLPPAGAGAGEFPAVTRVPPPPRCR